MYQGPEELSRAYGLRPVFVGIEPLEGGKYRVRLEEAPQGWELEPSGFLMQWYMDRLSQQIFRAPSYWLWSHRRWKLDGLETQTPTT
jgi:KDO2-lipid IV(A) lauroyltransferase